MALLADSQRQRHRDSSDSMIQWNAECRWNAKTVIPL
jgi:hypothetical protein